MKRPDLPAYYYHDHFLEMLSFVTTTYGPSPKDEHDAFVLRFQTLSKDAQCLLIRMVNRRGAIFNRTFFRYAEISDVERAADDLLACGQARLLKAEDYSAFVACLPKDILVAGAKAAGRTDIRRGSRRYGLLDRRKDVACGRRTRYVLRTLDAEVHPSCIHGLKHFFGRSGVALRDTELLERFRPPCTRDCKGFHVEIQDFTQLLRDFIRSDHRTKLDGALP